MLLMLGVAAGVYAISFLVIVIHDKTLQAARCDRC
jgi:predicted ABC-type transport system involved in lysophospholipase L1 biosynthesis ATPase subunit